MSVEIDNWKITVLAFLEQRQVIHADLKPENILLRGNTLSDSVIKVAGFLKENWISNSHSIRFWKFYEFCSIFCLFR